MGHEEGEHTKILSLAVGVHEFFYERCETRSGRSIEQSDFYCSRCPPLTLYIYL